MIAISVRKGDELALVETISPSADNRCQVTINGLLVLKKQSSV
jgi:hypothetical protein